MKNTRSWILLGGILLIGVAFLLLDFRVAASNTQSGKLIFTTDIGENMPVPMQSRDKISIVLVGEGPMVRALQKALPEQMGKAGNYFSSLKTQAGKRTISLGNNTIQKLIEHHKSQKNELERMENQWVDNNLLFPSMIGTPLNQRNLLRSF